MAQKHGTQSAPPAKGGTDKSGPLRVERNADSGDLRIAKHGNAKLSTTSWESKALPGPASRSANSGRYREDSVAGRTKLPGPTPDQAVHDTRKTEVVRARIDPAVKEEAAAVLATIGLTVSDAFRLLMIRVVSERALPFEPLVPNEDTIEAMRAARRGELVTVGSTAELLSSLDADD